MRLRPTSLLALAHGARSITILPGGTPKPFNGVGAVNSTEAFFKESAVNAFANTGAKVLMSNRDDTSYFFDPDFAVLPSSDSFLRGAMQAWGEHLHFTVGPDAVWLTILAQVSAYIGAHYKEDRIKAIFDLDSAPDIEIDYYPDWYAIVFAFFRGVEDRSKASWFRHWMAPTFTTSTDDEVIAAHVAVMGLAKGAPRINQAVLCGLPSVTLEGEQKDWEDMLEKLDRLPEFGPEGAEYRTRLAPILSRFVSSWKEPDSQATKDFWNAMVTAERADQCGGYNITGWATAFYFWEVDGTPYGRHQGKLVYDHVSYPSLNVQTLPVGYTRATFIVDDFNETVKYPAWAMGGAIGKRVDPGAPVGYFDALNRTGVSNDTYDAKMHSTLQPLVTWTFYGPIPYDTVKKASEWVVEKELDHVNTYIGSHFNTSHCTVHA